MPKHNTARAFTTRHLRTLGRTRSVQCAVTETLETRRLMAANLVISEFLASNSNSITDSFGNHEDWIEIHNAGADAANLNDYFLTDSASNLEEWRFPVQSLPAGGYLVVFASGKNLATAGSELHTNFKLSASGEYLALINAAVDSVQFEYAPTFPAQTTDISYGLFDANDPNSAKSFFTTPTPAAQNTPSTAPPVFSTNGKVFGSALTVSITTTTPNAQIRYTVDRTLPTQTSPLYTLPLTLSATTQIRAQAFAAGYTSSPVVSQSYFAADSTTSTFNSNLPIVVLDTFGQTINDTTNIGASASFINSTSASGATITDTPDFDGRIGLRIRGSTSETYPKKQYSIETWDENNDDKKISLLGMPADSDWILYAPYTERSLMQNDLAYKWANETGHYASRTRFVEVYLNSDGGTAVNYSSDYLGVYILIEKVKASSDRVDVTKMSPTDNTGDAVTGGYIFKKDRVETTEKSFTTTSQQQKFALVEPDETSITTQQLAYIGDYMNQFETALYGANWTDPVNGYAKYIDVGSFVDFYLVNEMTRNIDSFWLSTFYSKDRGGKVQAGPVWDFNLSLGAANYNDSSNAQGWDTDTLTNAQDPYFKRLLQDPNFVQKVSDRWHELRSTVFSTANLKADIDADVALLSNGNGNYPVGMVPTQVSNNAVVRNFKKWPELGTYVTTGSFFDPQGRWIEDVNFIKNWLSARVDWIDAQFVAAPTLSPGGTFPGSTSVTMTPHAQATASDSVLVDVGAPAKAFIPTSAATAITNWQLPSYVPPANWITGTTGIGYDRTTTGTGAVDFTPLIGLNVGAMYNVNTSVYTRVEFTLTQTQLDNLDHLILKMKYDDGFTAWVNGARVADAGSGENVNPTWNTVAAADRGDANAIVYQEFDISSVKSQLVVGTNVLAIQGMNSTKTSSDLLIVPQLISRHYVAATAGAVYYTTDGSDPRGTNGAVSATAILYNNAVMLSSSVRLRARTLVNGVWSGLADQIYNFTPDTLRITELMYHPTTNENFEFIEVKNTGTTSLNLAGYAFTNGVTFTFPNVSLAAGAYGVIVKDLTSFQTRYGTTTNVLGTYTGSLDNSGETVAFADNFGQTIQSFTYDDDGPGWYPQTDGSGYSLVIRDPTGDKANWSLAAGWRASYAVNGNPGAADDDTTAPTIVSASYSAASSTLQVQFSEPVQIGSPSGWTITELLTGATVTPTLTSLSGNTDTLTLPALSNGVYRLSIPATSVKDVASNALTQAFDWTLLYINNGQTLALPANKPAYLLDQLTIGTAAKLDLTNNALVVRNGDVGAWAAGGYTGLSGLITSARDNGAWDGAGIGSSLITTSAYTVGVTSASSLLGLAAGQTGSWQGLTVGAGDALLRYTIAGDATLNGTVDFSDLVILAQKYNQVGRSYAEGNVDWSSDGSVNFNDLVILAQNYGKSVPVVSTLIVAADKSIGPAKRKPTTDGIL